MALSLSFEFAAFAVKVNVCLRLDGHAGKGAAHGGVRGGQKSTCHCRRTQPPATELARGARLAQDKGAEPAGGTAKGVDTGTGPVGGMGVTCKRTVGPGSLGITTVYCLPLNS